jgi:tetratricopeptide (TPR) repeat protein
MKKIYYYLSTLLFTAALVSCGGKLSEIPAQYIQVNPEVLELKAGRVDAVITAKFPEKFFPKKAVLTVIPVLVSENGKELVGASATYQGEKVQGNNRAIPYKTGESVSQNVSFPFEEDFAKSELYLDFNLKTGKKEQKLPRIKVADGIITTPNLISARHLNPMLGNDKFQHNIDKAYEAEIKFLIQQSNIRSSELNSQKVKDLFSQIDNAKKSENQKIKSANVEAFASPDGPEALNYNLAQQRAKATVSLLNQDLKKTNVTVDSKFTAEDWDGFQKLVSASNIADKQQILNILSNYSDPAEREAQIKKMSSVYKELAEDILPQLRRAKMKVTIETIGRSNEQILEYIEINPNELNVEELLYAATLVNKDDRKAKIYQIVIDNFPNDYRGHNNLGHIKFISGDVVEAAPLFQRAFDIENNSVTHYNMALIDLDRKDYKKAVSHLTEAKTKGASKDVVIEPEAMILIHDGKYSEAASSLTNTQINTAALAQILVKDYAKASQTLSVIKNPDATTDYLKAIIGARTNNKNQVISNLQAAIEQKKSLARKAKSDVEFSKFFVDPDFKEIVK